MIHVSTFRRQDTIDIIRLDIDNAMDVCRCISVAVDGGLIDHEVMFSLSIPCNCVQAAVSYQDLKETLYTISLPSKHG